MEEKDTYTSDLAVAQLSICFFLPIGIDPDRLFT